MPLSRRTVLAGLAASAATPGFAAPIGPTMRERVSGFLRQLDPAQRDAATYPFDQPQRLAWNYMLGSRRAPGVALEDLTPALEDAARDLLSSALSTRGMEKAGHIMLQQDILRDEWGKGSADRNQRRFSVMVFGEPSSETAWAWRWEGHHLSLTFTLVGDTVVSTTPHSFSSEPNTVPSGPHEGLVVLREEEALARTLFADFTDVQRAAALVNTESPGNVLTTRGREDRYDGDTRGLPLADMSTSQRDRVLRLLDVYTAESFAPALAPGLATRAVEGDLDSTRFVWAGADPDGSIYYRIHGPTTLIEFASLRNQPLHLHTAVHDIGRNHGAHAV